MMISRLDSISRELAGELRNATSVVRRKAAAIACEIAASRTSLEGYAVTAALESLRSGKQVDDVLRQQLKGIAARFDDQYFRLKERGGEEAKAEVLQLFSKARAASALACAFSENAGNLEEAIYEAIAAMDDPADVIQPVSAALQSEN